MNELNELRAEHKKLRLTLEQARRIDLVVLVSKEHVKIVINHRGDTKTEEVYRITYSSGHDDYYCEEAALKNANYLMTNHVRKLG